jgi:hypothetical protein
MFVAARYEPDTVGAADKVFRSDVGNAGGARDMRSIEVKKTKAQVSCRTASGDLRWMVAQSPHDADARGSRQGGPLRKPWLVVAALPLALLFAYGFIRFMLELVFPLAVTRH